MTQEISSLVDGELESPDADRAIKACCASAEGARAWHEYHLIGEALRHGAVGGTDVTGRVMGALASEPTVLAPRPSRVMGVARVALAAAASVATVAVVGWIGFTGTSAPTTPVVATSAPAGPGLDAGVTRPVNHTVSVPSADVHDYVVAHRQTVTSEHYRPVAATVPARP